MIAKSQAIVFRTSSGRRYLTKRAAFHGEAMQRLYAKNEKAGCLDYPHGRQDTFYTDWQMEHFRKVSARFWRMFRKFV